MSNTMAEVVRETRTLRHRYARQWFAEHLLKAVRAPEVFTARLARAQASARQQLVAQVAHRERQVITVERRADLTPELFVRDYLNGERPVVLEGAARDWPCVQEWTLAGLGQRFPDEPIRLIRTGPGENPEPGTGESTTFGAVIQRIERGEKPYIRFSSFVNRHPELMEQFDKSWLCRMSQTSEEAFANYGFFMGAEGTATGLHSAMAPNLFIQIYGQRRWYIYPARLAAFLRPVVKASPFFFSPIDASCGETEELLRHIPVYEAILQPGDVLFNPAFFWHQVHNLASSVGVGYRWTSLRQAFRVAPLQSLITLTATNPPVWQLRHQLDLPTVIDQKTR